jgi:hypothetical protein
MAISAANLNHRTAIAHPVNRRIGCPASTGTVSFGGTARSFHARAVELSRRPLHIRPTCVLLVRRSTDRAAHRRHVPNVRGRLTTPRVHVMEFVGLGWRSGKRHLELSGLRPKLRAGPSRPISGQRLGVRSAPGRVRFWLSERRALLQRNDRVVSRQPAGGHRTVRRHHIPWKASDPLHQLTR